MSDLWGDRPDPPPPPSSFEQYSPIRPQRTWRDLARKAAAPFIFVGALLAKFKFVLFALFKLKFVGTALSMIVSIGAYGLAFGWWFGVGFVVLIFIHEMGHAIELKRQGVPFSAPLFIPFLGAAIGMRGLPHDAWREARVGLAGPVLGSVGAALCWLIAVQVDSNLLRALAFVGFFLNLFNLLPFLPLDGGRAAAALHPALWGLGLAAVAALAFFRPNPILILILVVGGLEVWRRWKQRHDPHFADYYRVTVAQRTVIAVTYFGLAALLVLAMHELRSVPH